MAFPERFSSLPEYAFPRLRKLLDDHTPGGEVLHMTIGEPKHPFPKWVADVLSAHVDGFAKYPPNDGMPELLEAITGFVTRRYGVDLDPMTQVMALNGTREGLFNSLLALCVEKTSDGKKPIILIPNPFYQVYAVAALAVNAEPIYVGAEEDTNFLPDYTALSPEVLNRTEVAYVCSPTNPQGAVATREYWQALIALAEKYDFKIFADECYSEIYRDAPPVGGLEIAQEMGADPERVVIFHSLSKRSNLPGLRSGFVAGGIQSISRIKRLRSYAGAPLPLPLQHVAARAWSDDQHVFDNRVLYREKYLTSDEVFKDVPGYRPPEAGFFLWLPVADAEQAALTVWQQTGVRVLPGSYLSREIDGKNPGNGYIRVAMVAPKEEMARGLIRLRDCLYN